MYNKQNCKLHKNNLCNLYINSSINLYPLLFNSIYRRNLSMTKANNKMNKHNNSFTFNSESSKTSKMSFNIGIY